MRSTIRKTETLTRANRIAALVIADRLPIDYAEQRIVPKLPAICRSQPAMRRDGIAWTVLEDAIERRGANAYAIYGRQHPTPALPL